MKCRNCVKARRRCRWRTWRATPAVPSSRFTWNGAGFFSAINCKLFFVQTASMALVRRYVRDRPAGISRERFVAELSALLVGYLTAPPPARTASRNLRRCGRRQRERRAPRHGAAEDALVGAVGRAPVGREQGLRPGSKQGPFRAWNILPRLSQDRQTQHRGGVFPGGEELFVTAVPRGAVVLEHFWRASPSRDRLNRCETGSTPGWSRILWNSIAASTPLPAAR